MVHLQRYLDQKNRWARLSGRPGYLALETINQQVAAELFRSLGCELSPENLTCDGELRGRALQEKTAMLRGAVRDLEWMGYTAPEDAYL
jgi:hypothetical protein